MARNKTPVRRAIEMKPKANKPARTVTFSKRRATIFKKANELSTMTGCQIAIGMFSEGNRAYSFGHPSVQSVTERFLGQNPVLVASSVDGDIALGLNQEYENLCEQLRKEKIRGKDLEMSCGEQMRIQSMSLDQLKRHKKEMEELKEKVVKMVAQISPVESASSSHRGKKRGFDFDLNVAPNEFEI